MEQTRTGSPAADDSTVDVAKQQAGDVASQASQAGRDVAQTAKTEATEVLRDAGQQAKEVWNQARAELTSQSSAQQQRAASGLSNLSSELREMSQGGQHSGVASDLAGQAADKADQLATWLQNNEPADIINEAKAFARRQPGLFLAGAAVVGLLAGRLTRSLADDHRDDGADTASADRRDTGLPSGNPDAYARPAGMPNTGGATR